MYILISNDKQEALTFSNTDDMLDEYDADPFFWSHCLHFNGKVAIVHPASDLDDWLATRRYEIASDNRHNHQTAMAAE